MDISNETISSANEPLKNLLYDWIYKGRLGEMKMVEKLTDLASTLLCAEVKQLGFWEVYMENIEKRGLELGFVFRIMFEILYLPSYS